MAQKTFTVNTDALVSLRQSDGLSLGAGQDQHLPIGLHGSTYLLRSLAKFNTDFSDVVSINWARLYLRASSYHIACGGSAGINVRRITTSWSEGTRGADEIWYGDNAVEWSNQPSVTSSGEATDSSFGRTANVWEYVDITTIVDAWRTGSANYGVRLASVNEGSTSYATGFYARESSYDPYILVDYETNRAPSAPTLGSPSNGGVVTDTTPDLKFTPSDPDGDVHTKYHYQVDNNSDFSSPVEESDVSGSFTNAVEVTRTVTTTLTRGTTYYWRVKTYDGTEWGPYSSSRSFIVNSLPVATLTDPAATGHLAHMTMTPASGWASPRLYIAWNYSDAQGQAQTQYNYEVANDSGGSPGSTLVSGTVASSATNVTPSATYVEGNYYHVRVRVYDGYEWSAYSGWFRVRARWGLDTHTSDVRISASPPASWQTQSYNATTGSKSAIALEYNGGTNGAGAGLGSWKASLADVTPNNYAYYRVWFFAWGASPATVARLNDLTIRATGSVAQPDFWLPIPLSSENASLDEDNSVFGSQGLRIEGDGSTHAITQQIYVEANREYVLQGRVRSIGNSGARIELRDSQSGAAILSTDTHTADSDWTQDTAAVWDAGNRTAVWIAVVVDGLAGTAAIFDGLKMERGVVASPWTPGLVGSATTVDVGGVAVDGTKGGVFRLRATDGGTLSLATSNSRLLEGVDGSIHLEAVRFTAGHYSGVGSG